MVASGDGPILRLFGFIYIILQRNPVDPRRGRLGWFPSHTAGSGGSGTQPGPAGRKAGSAG